MDLDLKSLDSSISKKFKHREIVVRFTSILIIALAYSWFSGNHKIAESLFWKLSGIHFLFVAIMWNGSMFIIQYCVNQISIFKNPVKLIVILIVSLTALVIIAEVTFLKCRDYFYHTHTSSDEIRISVFLSWLITFFISTVYTCIGFFIQWKENFIRSELLKKANVEAQYETLKTQVNPHYLFNSLNTLLTMITDNPDASRYVVSLSDFMRYMLQSRSKEAVLLCDELKIAEEYVFLQKSRFGDKLLVNLNIDEKFFHFAVPPLSLQMLLENAIKHNTVSKEDPLHIEVYITPENYLVVENIKNEKMDKEPSTGIGLDNIKNRYLYLTGKNVIIENNKHNFKVSLPLVEISI